GHGEETAHAAFVEDDRAGFAHAPGAELLLHGFEEFPRQERVGERAGALPQGDGGLEVGGGEGADHGARYGVALVGSPRDWFSATASLARRRATVAVTVSPSRSSSVAISYLPPGLRRGSMSRRRLPRQKPKRTRAASARITITGPFER